MSRLHTLCLSGDVKMRLFSVIGASPVFDALPKKDNSDIRSTEYITVGN